MQFQFLSFRILRFLIYLLSIGKFKRIIKLGEIKEEFKTV